MIKRSSPEQHPLLKCKESARYFFALWPKESTAKALRQRAVDLLQKDEVTDEKKLHLTLLYLGQVYPEFVDRAIKAAAEIKAAPFHLEITRVSFFNERNIVCLKPKKTPGFLIELISKLSERLLQEGFVPDKRAFTPHITIARRAQKKVKTDVIEPIDWEVDAFCLVKSIVQPTGPAKYEIVERWLFSER